MPKIIFKESARSEGLKTLHRMVTEVKRDGEVPEALRRKILAEKDMTMLNENRILEQLCPFLFYPLYGIIYLSTGDTKYL